MCGFFRFLEPFATRGGIWPCHLNLTQSERGLQLQAKKTQVARTGQPFLSGGLRSAQVFPGCHDVGMIKYHRDSNGYILALFRKSDRFGDGCTRLVYLSLLKKGSG